MINLPNLARQPLTPTVVRGGGIGVRLCAMQWIARRLGNPASSPGITPRGVAPHLSSLVVSVNDSMCKHAPNSDALCRACADAVMAIARRTVGTESNDPNHFWQWAYEALTSTEWGAPAYSPAFARKYASAAARCQARLAGQTLAPMVQPSRWAPYCGNARLDAHGAASIVVHAIRSAKLTGRQQAEATGKAIDAWRRITALAPTEPTEPAEAPDARPDEPSQAPGIPDETPDQPNTAPGTDDPAGALLVATLEAYLARIAAERTAREHAEQTTNPQHNQPESVPA